ncbi:YgiW/YdeI family stress tolerance OB fold protein [Desulfovibrio sp. OttesenSCG-928-O18]|nr:YgiW/YdeI family stress tolerance OB fold protein [Desulfovibrio sp. OttesenSCG-928-O18]
MTGKRLTRPYAAITASILGTAVLALALAASPASAAAPGGGYSGPGPAVVTVEQARLLSDDSHITLRGKIVQSLGGKKYLFRDATGTVTLEIKHNRWEGRQIGPDQEVEIHGELDKDWTSIEVEVDRIVPL